MTTTSPKAGFQLERIAFFSDAVFAIAITLLIIEVRAPVFESGVTNREALSLFLWQFVPELLGVLVSFFLISLNWRRHHQLFGILSGYDDKLITLNFFALVGIIFLPFSTAILSHNWRRFWINPLHLPFVIYSLNNLVCAFFNYLLFRYALNPRNALYKAGAVREPARIHLEILFPVCVFATTTVVGYFNSAVACASFALFAFEPLFIKLFSGRKNGEIEFRDVENAPEP